MKTQKESIKIHPVVSGACFQPDLLPDHKGPVLDFPYMAQNVLRNGRVLT